MKKNTKKIKNFFGKKNLSKLTSLGLSLALGATIGGHAFSENAGTNSLTTDNEGNDPNLNQSIEAHVRVVDNDPIYNIRVDWQDMNFVATVTNTATGDNHNIEWSGGGNNSASSKVWVQNGSSCSIDTRIKYAEDHTYFQNIEGQLMQQNDAGWKTLTANSARSAGDITGATATADMPLGTMPNAYAIAAPADAAEYTNDVYHDFRGVFNLTLSGGTTDNHDNITLPPKRIVGLYDYQSRIAGTTTLTFSKKSDMA